MTYEYRPTNTQQNTSKLNLPVYSIFFFLISGTWTLFNIWKFKNHKIIFVDVENHSMKSISFTNWKKFNKVEIGRSFLNLKKIPSQEPIDNVNNGKSFNVYPLRLVARQDIYFQNFYLLKSLAGN